MSYRQLNHHGEVTPWVRPSRSDVYKVRFIVGVFTGNMKNGKKLRVDMYEPITVTCKDMGRNTPSKLKKLIKSRTNLAHLAFESRIEKYLSGKRRVGLPKKKGYFYFLNMREIKSDEPLPAQ